MCSPGPFPESLLPLGFCPTKKGKRQLRAAGGIWEKDVSSAGSVPIMHLVARDSLPLGKSLFFFFPFFLFKGKGKKRKRKETTKVFGKR